MGMRITLRELRQIIREAIQDSEFHESFDGSSYEISVEHDKTLTLDSDETVTMNGYSSSQLRATISKSKGKMTLTYVRVSLEGQGQNLALRMGLKALKFAKEHGLKLVTSGVYSKDGKRLVAALSARGKIIDTSDGHEIKEAIGPSNSPMDLGDDMPRIVSYGKQLGDDDGTGESGEDKDINEFQSHRPGNVKPSMMLGTSYMDDNDPENSDEDFPTRLPSLKNELLDPGYQSFARTMDHDTDDVDGPNKMKDETSAWYTCLELYDTVKDTWGLTSMSNPTFIDAALGELKKNGTPSGTITRMRFRLENENGG